MRHPEACVVLIIFFAATAPPLVAPAFAQSSGVSISRPAHFGELAYNAFNGLVYAANDGNASVAVFDPKTGETVANVPMTGLPWGIAFASSLNEAFVANEEVSNIAVIDCSTNQLTGTIAAGNSLAGLAFDPQNGLLYGATPYGTSVQVFNPATGITVATIPLPAVPQEIVYDSGNGRIYVGLYALCYPESGLCPTVPPATSVAVIDPSTNTLISTVDVGAYLQGLAYDPADGYILSAGLGSGNLAVISDSSNMVVANVTFGASSSPTFVTYDSADDEAYVSLSTLGEVAVVDLHSFAVKQTIATATGPEGLAYDPYTGLVYSGVFSGFVQIFNPRSNSITGAIGASLLTVNYEAYGGEGFGPPLFTLTQNGVTGREAIPSGGLSVYLDAGSRWEIQQVLNGSQASERWVTGNTTTGIVGPPESLNFTYFDQVPVEFTYSSVGGNLPQARPILVVQYGKAANIPANTTSWVDKGTSYQYEKVIAPVVLNPEERWSVAGNGSGKVLSAGYVEETYYHQFLDTFSFKSAGIGFMPQPMLTLTNFGQAVNTTLPNPIVTFAPATYWMDAGKNWSVTNPISASTQGERWYSSNPTEGIVTQAESVNLTYRLQYYLSVQSSPFEGGSVSPNGGWYASGSTIELTASPAPGWTFGGWSGSAEVSYVGQETNGSVTLLGPAAVVAQFSPAATTTTSAAPSGGIPEFPDQLLAAIALVLIVVLSYLVARGRARS